MRGGTITESFGRGGKGGSRSRSRSRAGAGKAAALVGAKDAARLPKRAGGDTAPDERPDTPPHTPGTFTKEQLAEAEGRPHLDVRDTRYDALWREVQAKMGMPTHQPSKCPRAASHLALHTILRKRARATTHTRVPACFFARLYSTQRRNESDRAHSPCL